MTARERRGSGLAACVGGAGDIVPPETIDERNQTGKGDGTSKGDRTSKRNLSAQASIKDFLLSKSFAK